MAFSKLVLSTAIFSLFYVTTFGSPAALAPLPARSNLEVGSHFQDLAYYAQYSAAAYCPENYAGELHTKVACQGNNCPDVERSATEIMLKFADTTFTNMNGFVAIDNEHKTIVVAFRGTWGVKNVVADIDMRQANVYLCKGCTAHKGFWNALVLTGHSLGGAVAQLAAIELRNSHYPLTLITYGQPRVGNQALVDYMHSQPGDNFRVTHNQDPIPLTPPRGKSPYRHFSPEYKIMSSSGVTPDPKHIVLKPGNDDDPSLSATQAWKQHDAMSHRWYFRYIPGCRDRPSIIEAAMRNQTTPSL